MLFDGPARALRRGGASEQRHEAGCRFHLDRLARLFVPVVVHSVLFIPKVFVDQPDHVIGVKIELAGVRMEAEVIGDNGHRAKFADEIGSQVDALDVECAHCSGAAPLVIRPCGIGRVPNWQAIVVVIV